MAIDPQTYKVAAGEHAAAALALDESARYALAHYVAGLAVECMLRAYRCRINPEFDARHDLGRLYRLAKFTDVVPESQMERVLTALSVVIAQWSNEHRFRSDEALRKYLVKLRLFEGIKGDFVKEWTRRIVEAATVIVTEGALRWKK